MPQFGSHRDCRETRGLASSNRVRHPERHNGKENHMTSFENEKAGPRILAMVAVLFVLSFFCQAAIAGENHQITTDKDTYDYGEPVNVKFSNALGDERDWICIVPVGSPDTEAGDYKYIPKGLNQGVLVFDPPAPGKYEARAYYDYGRKGYVVSGRHAFTVVSSPAAEAAMAARMERKINPNNPLESNLLQGNGLVYVFREPWYLSTCDVEIIANGNPIVVLPNKQYYLYSVAAGEVNFMTGSLIENDIAKGTREEVWSSQPGNATIKVKPGYVYYLKLKVLPAFGMRAYLEHVPHYEGANLIASYKLTLFK